MAAFDGIFVEKLTCFQTSSRLAALVHHAIEMVTGLSSPEAGVPAASPYSVDPGATSPPSTGQLNDEYYRPGDEGTESLSFKFQSDTG
jgi:hypothetical protein